MIIPVDLEASSCGLAAARGTRSAMIVQARASRRAVNNCDLAISDSFQNFEPLVVILRLNARELGDAPPYMMLHLRSSYLKSLFQATHEVLKDPVAKPGSHSQLQLILIQHEISNGSNRQQAYQITAQDRLVDPWARSYFYHWLGNCMYSLHRIVKIC